MELSKRVAVMVGPPFGLCASGAGGKVADRGLRVKGRLRRQRRLRARERPLLRETIAVLMRKTVPCRSTYPTQKARNHIMPEAR